ncbi:MAG: hypothetical protein SFU27_01835 [Thermonemataceae bacterium]|nr:hypothetical protein [Thermonemataceae bacterium]
MKKLFKTSLFFAVFFLAALLSSAQSKKVDIPVANLPKEVKGVLEQYVEILRNAKDVDDCANQFTAIAGGSLVNEDVENISLRQTVKPFSLKKDYNDIKFYAYPIKITRVNVSNTSGTGYGASAVAGKIYKVWIEKANKNNGMPAPISIIVPENHPTIKTPKVVGIGSL